MLQLGILLLANLCCITTTTGELQNSTTSGSYVFQTYTDIGYYPDQTQFCEDRGGWPSEPRNETLNNDLASILSSTSDNNGYFIGLVQQDGQWKWQTDKTIATAFTEWTPGEGQGSALNPCNIYAAITDAGEWEDRWGTSGCGAKERRFTCQYSPCGSGPCQNGGSCSIDSGADPPNYDCACVIGSSGANCENDYCTSNPCENGGSCTPTVGKEPYYNCICPNGYYGNNCQNDYCTSNPCENGGTCTPTFDKEPYYRCTCEDGYYGNTCQKFLQVATDQVVVAVEGYSIILNVNVTSIGSMSKVTLRDGTSILEEKNNVETSTITFNLTNVQESDEGEYTITASSLSAESYEKTTKTFMKVHVEARVQSLKPNFIFSPTTTSGPDKVTCKVYGKPTPEYEWFKDGNSVLNDNTDGVGVYQAYNSTANEVVLHVERARLSDNGTYVCRATNKVGKDDRKVTVEQTTALAVYGSPVIESSTAKPCTNDGEITLNWKPNEQTESVNHRGKKLER